MQKFKKEIAVLTNYIQTAKPVLESKILHEKLEEKALKDPLTSFTIEDILKNLLMTILIIHNLNIAF